MKRAIARGLPFLALVVALLGFGAPARSAGNEPTSATVASGQPARDADPIVLKGRDLGPTWTAPANATLSLPAKDLDCYLTSGDTICPDRHNHYEDPDLDSSRLLSVTGTPVDRVLAYRWDPEKHAFVQIPVQVDEVFTRYLNNNASGFGIYSGTDEHTSYAFDREGFRYTRTDGLESSNPCVARADSPPARDPVPGLDGDDEVAFMAFDAGPPAPSDAKLPDGIEGVKSVALLDPAAPDRSPSYVYLMRASENGPKPAYDATNGYVRYQRDPNADFMVFSQSTYSDYGNAAPGYYCTPSGEIVRNPDGTPKIGRRRPLDTATVTTPRYSFRYEGRWLMTQIRISPHDDWHYGPDLVDRWKARAFAQDPSSKTPCCGYEEEETNWGGSSTLLGERVGPVRVIRETWGADSGTNVIRRETFYRNSMVQTTFLRVHPIPPVDGIYAQWDFNAGRVDRYYTDRLPAGVPIDGRNDEVYGNLDDPCNSRWDSGVERSEADARYRELYRQTGLCNAPYHLSADAPDLTASNPNAALGWGVTTGDFGTIVDRITVGRAGVTPLGAVQAIFAVPYYRDDSCFDDGTGADPGPVLFPRRPEEESKTRAPDGGERRCWDARRDPTPPGSPQGAGDPRFWQGSIGTHGLHLLFVAESDNARLTKPVSEIVSDWQMVFLPGRRDAAAGEQYGRSFERPLVPVVLDRALVGPDQGSRGGGGQSGEEGGGAGGQGQGEAGGQPREGSAGDAHGMPAPSNGAHTRTAPVVGSQKRRDRREGAPERTARAERTGRRSLIRAPSVVVRRGRLRVVFVAGTPKGWSVVLRLPARGAGREIALPVKCRRVRARTWQCATGLAPQRVVAALYRSKALTVLVTRRGDRQYPAVKYRLALRVADTRHGAHASGRQ